MWAAAAAPAPPRPWRGTALRAAAALALALCATPAAAQRCRQLAATNMVFTNYTPFGPGVAATADISYDCQSRVNLAWIGISFPRTMNAGGNALQFELYREASHTNVWPASPPLVPVPVSRSGLVRVYGFLPPQESAAGVYQGTVTVTIYADAQNNPTDAASMIVQTSNFVDSCIINPATLAFGSYDPLGPSALDGQSALQVACTRGTPYAVGLGTGNNPSGAMRQMASGGQLLQYQLYSDGARTTVWDNGSTVGGVAASIAPVDLPVYGRVTAGQMVPAGTYQDVVTSTINF